ncbi:ribonuclease H-like domain-containing protein [Bacillus sp. CGMCC 1.16541]|uniref:ribonuclease H-like domain-containing protein n=1 Tax=Bacillus sp. CGMCC 1.16541 TaxID=2185143 RepID=UPI000D734AEC|nr:ribonuclease H-like domain-containing protein [Bacillus sp. CGMCC 1.16541]
MAMKNKLKKLRKHIVREEVEKKGGKEEKVSESPSSIPFLQQWIEFGAKPVFYEGEYIFIREVTYPLSQQHGLYPFSDLHVVADVWWQVDIQHPLSLKNKQVSEVFFFDTETTGLSGGAGTTIFLLGYAQLEGNVIKVKQYFLPSPSAETALYYFFLKDISEFTTSIVYNGKSFDWPQVKTRHTLLRNELPPLPKLEHFDLLHPARRLWKHKLDSVKLTKVEEEVLNIKRQGDIPGYLAPMIYFDYVDRKNPQGVFEVMKHNEHDILSLVTLYIHLSNQLLQGASLSIKETFEVARWYDQLGEKKIARPLYENVSAHEQEEHDKAKMAIALQYKREKQWDKCMDLWRVVYQTGCGKTKREAAIELAKVYEHRYKNFDEALACTKQAYQWWKEKNQQIKMYNEKEKLAFEKRMKRLEVKIERDT